MGLAPGNDESPDRFGPGLERLASLTRPGDAPRVSNGCGGQEREGQTSPVGVTDDDATGFQDGAVEMEEHAPTPFDARTVIAEAWCLHQDGIATGSEQVFRKLPAERLFRLGRCIGQAEEIARRFASGKPLGVEGVVEIP
ncbi:hypothetical protein B1810_10705 [Panacagrimonas perspica]|uniref:hypothetical protein n=1 Tax=Panacagrimonas perspica TaxID=381431 RepID=UPI00105C64E5|nr:hypothetical protein [Panacagrimonas perspica]THD03058.1 hypothetical protein B1810_10705 [Panacagrimonas perspica]